jgi:predicted nucleic acid-binding protein
MILLDTSIWIEYFRNNQEYFPKVSGLLENREVLAVECVFGELLQGTKNKAEREIIRDFWTHLPKESYENSIIEAGLYSAEHTLMDKGVGLIDAIILMHGLKSKSKIWTLDTKLLKVIPEALKYVNSPNAV